MNGSAPTPAAKQERGTTAAEICVLIPHECGEVLLARAFASRPPGEDRIRGVP
jgi:hypothetical protein